MADTGYASADNINQDNAVGTLNWSGPGNSSSQNDVYAYTAGSMGAISTYLKHQDFDFAVPAGATINGVVVEVDSYSSAFTGLGAAYDTVKLVKDGSVAGNDLGTGYVDLTDDDAYDVFGGSSEMWGLELTPDDINDTTFGCVISLRMYNPSSFIAYVDHIRMKVYYTEAAGGEIKVVEGVAIASVKKVAGVAIASVKKLAGVSNV